MAWGILASLRAISANIRGDDGKCYKGPRERGANNTVYLLAAGQRAPTPSILAALLS